MKNLRKWWKAALGIVLAGVVLQIAASLLVNTAPLRRFFTRQLESSFGRPVEVRRYSASLFPTPQLDAYGISVAEDPAFGQEYFLRADRLSAGLRWFGLLRVRFELGTLQLDKPSLILVRNKDGRWNLESWLPSVRSERPADSANFRPAAPATHHLRKIHIYDGRINFKLDNDKASFAFIAVKGNVEQIAAGRWRLDLESEPWRSGVIAQLPGTVRLRGDVAGTSARLQPAHLEATWGDSSLADVFRLFGGRDYGVRGLFAAELTMESGDASRAAALEPGDWSFSFRSRASGIHRWDLTERDDNPRVGIRVAGRWNPGRGITEAREVRIETPRSNVRGSATLTSLSGAGFAVRLDSAGLQGADFLDWYRAFRPDVSELVAGNQYFTGSATLEGWPVRIRDAAFSSAGGRWTIPGFSAPVEVRAIRGGTERGRLVVAPFVVSVPVRKNTAKSQNAEAREEAAGPAGILNVSVQGDLDRQQGYVRLEGQLPQAAAVFAFTSAIGRNLQQGWEAKGKLAGDMRWEWGGGAAPRWSGRAELARGELQIAGLNQPVTVDGLRAEWRGSQRKFSLNKVEAFGAVWNGSIDRAAAAEEESDTNLPSWSFQLQADHLDAAELDRWIGPRARPSWLQRLLPSALGGKSAPSISSVSGAVLNRLRAEGDLRADEVTIEKIRLKAFRSHAKLAAGKLQLQNAQAQWSGGAAQGSLVASLSANPTYEVVAAFDGVSLAQTPWLAQLSDHLAGVAGGNMELRAGGIGRDALLKSLTGKGELQLSKIELRGWDLAGTMAVGEWKPGISRWPAGSGTFHVNDGDFELNALRLASASEEFLLKGSVSFAQDADLTAESHATGRNARSPSAIRFLTISGPLKEPKVSLERTTAQQPGD